MSNAVKEVWSSIRSLSQQEQSELFELFLAEWDTEPDSSHDAELLRRSEEVDGGVANLLDGNEAMRLFRERKKA